MTEVPKPQPKATDHSSRRTSQPDLFGRIHHIYDNVKVPSGIHPPIPIPSLSLHPTPTAPHIQSGGHILPSQAVHAAEHNLPALAPPPHPAQAHPHPNPNSNPHPNPNPNQTNTSAVSSKSDPLLKDAMEVGDGETSMSHEGWSLKTHTHKPATTSSTGMKMESDKAHQMAVAAVSVADEEL